MTLLLLQKAEDILVWSQGVITDIKLKLDMKDILIFCLCSLGECSFSASTLWKGKCDLMETMLYSSKAEEFECSIFGSTGLCLTGQSVQTHHFQSD